MAARPCRVTEDSPGYRKALELFEKLRNSAKMHEEIKEAMRITGLRIHDGPDGLEVWHGGEVVYRPKNKPLGYAFILGAAWAQR